MQGATSVEAMHSLLEQAGFRLHAHVDCTRELKELAARMVLQHGSPAAFWHGWQRQAEGAPLSLRETPAHAGACPAPLGAEVPLCWRGLGYALFVAQKVE